MGDVGWLIAGDFAAAAAAGAGLWAVLIAKRFGKDTSAKLSEIAAAQDRTVTKLAEVAVSMEHTVALVDEAARSAELSRRREADRLAKEAVPRLTIQAPAPGSKDEIDVTAVNTGGPASPVFIVIGTPAGGLYGGSWDIPRDSPVIHGGAKRIGSTTVQSKLIIAVARDANGCWWDQQTFDRVDDPLLDSPDRTQAFNSWARRVTGAAG